MTSLPRLPLWTSFGNRESLTDQKQLAVKSHVVQVVNRLHRFFGPCHLNFCDADGAPVLCPRYLNRQHSATLCVDCHNVVAHRVAPTPEQAVDAALAAGRIDRGLPFVRREAVRLMKSTYQTSDEAARVIDEDLRKFYTSRGRAVDAQVTGAVTALQTIYRRNVFPIMKVTFGTYPDNLGHMTSSGCFRCHDGSLTAKDGTTINADCEYCHKQIEKPSQ